MLGRWLFVRLNAAEKALRQGRIDDAYGAALQPDIRELERGQRLRDALVRPFLARARLHRQAGRLSEALADLERLEAIGRCNPDVETLRQLIRTEMRADARRDADDREAADRAARNLAAGRLDTGRHEVRRVADTEQRADLNEELEHRLLRSAELLDQARAALERGDTLAAARIWQDACRRYGRTRDSDALASSLAADFRQLWERWLDEGRLDRLAATRAELAALAAVEPSLAECEQTLELLQRGTGQLSRADYLGLRQTMLRLKVVRGEAAWVSAALEALSAIAECQDRLRATPLGLFNSLAEPPIAAAPFATDITPEAPTLARPLHEPPPSDGIRLAGPVLILVDGGGSSVILSADRVRIGRGGHSATVDLPVPGAEQAHHADIVRRGEDYFLTAYGPTQVNRRRVEHTLLRDGDRITLGIQAKMVFSKPSGKSDSAVLRLSHRCRLPQDVSSVVLFRDTCLVGPAGSAHLPTQEPDGQVVLFERGGVLHARQTAGSGWMSNPPQVVRAGQTLEFGGLRLTAKPYELKL
jgi:hypothetical protein